MNGVNRFRHFGILSRQRRGVAARRRNRRRRPGGTLHPAEARRPVGGVRLTDLEAIVFYDKPLVKFERLLETYLAEAPRGYRSFAAAMPVWLKEKLFLKPQLKKELARLGQCGAPALPPLYFAEHHQAHAASAFYPSPFSRAAVLCMDGVGEWATTSVWLGEGHTLTPQWQIDFPHSLGLLYSAFTYYTGFKVNSGEYKLMGLAPYGEPTYVDLILKQLLDLKEDGTFRLNMDYFHYTTGLTMTNAKFNALFGGPPRAPEEKLTQREMNLARSIQAVTEEVVLRLARTIHRELGVDALCLAGGALGAALAFRHQYQGQPRTATGTDRMAGAYLGPRFSASEIKGDLDSVGAVYELLDDEPLMGSVAEILAREQVVGWFQGRMEFGPRALGARSIIGDPRNEKMQSVMNLKIKYRESFRPFAPSVLFESVSAFFDLDRPSPYMLLTASVREEHRLPMTSDSLAGH